MFFLKASLILVQNKYMHKDIINVQGVSVYLP